GHLRSPYRASSQVHPRPSALLSFKMCTWCADSFRGLRGPTRPLWLRLCCLRPSVVLFDMQKHRLVLGGFASLRESSCWVPAPLLCASVFFVSSVCVRCPVDLAYPSHPWFLPPH